MKISRTLITTLSLAIVASLVLTTFCQAKEAPTSQQTSPLASKLIPQPKARASRSLSDMFEKVKSKIFGSKKQATVAASSNNQQQVQPAASVNVAQRQPWGDLNSFNQQYSPYSALSSSYQWPASSAGSSQQYLGQQFNSLGSYMPSGSAYPGLTGAQSQQVDGSQQQAGSSIGPAANSNGASSSNGGLLSSASHLIAQYLSPSSSSASQQSLSSAAASQQANGQQQNLMTPQQQQQQSQYNEFASILDSMVAQTGAGSQRQPSLNQYLGGAGIGPQQQQPSQQGYQAAPGSPQIMPTGSMLGDNDMSASSSIQSYMPAAGTGQAGSNQAAQSPAIGGASGKSSMVGLAEQLAPGAQFNKLVSFPFSLSSNEDPNKEGRYKLHIPFLNQHVKRSDQPQQAVPVAGNSNQQQQIQRQQQQQQQQYLNSYYNQQQQYLAQQQLSAQASQVVPTIVSPQSNSASSLPASNAAAQPQSPSSSSSVSQQQSSPLASISASVPQSVSSSSSLQQSSIPSSASSSLIQSQNSRSAWSVADLQSSPSSSSSSLSSSSSSSKLIPMQQSAVPSSIEPASQN